MFRNPTVIAAIILSAGMLISSALICVFIDSLATTLEQMPLAHTQFSPSPSELTLDNGKSRFDVQIKNEQPILVKQVP